LKISFSAGKYPERPFENKVAIEKADSDSKTIDFMNATQPLLVKLQARPADSVTNNREILANERFVTSLRDPYLGVFDATKLLSSGRLSMDPADNIYGVPVEDACVLQEDFEEKKVNICSLQNYSN
jgi:hypothetical protein